MLQMTMWECQKHDKSKKYELLMYRLFLESLYHDSDNSARTLDSAGVPTQINKH
jgi:hypothetical protein